jgi:hypothetical protein
MDRLPSAGADLGIQMGDHGTFAISLRQEPDGTGGAPEIRWFPPADPYMTAYRQMGGGNLR